MLEIMAGPPPVPAFSMHCKEIPSPFFSSIVYTPAKVSLQFHVPNSWECTLYTWAFSTCNRSAGLGACGTLGIYLGSKAHAQGNGGTESKTPWRVSFVEAGAGGYWEWALQSLRLGRFRTDPCITPSYSLYLSMGSLRAFRFEKHKIRWQSVCRSLPRQH